jgi:hypothetical protein
MTKKILCIGDSFTYGDELPDPASQSWPSLLAKDNGWDVNNLGKSGCSLERCIRVLFEEIDKGYDLVILGCPPWVRQEIYFKPKKTFITSSAHKKIATIPWENGFYEYSYDDLIYYKKWLTSIIQIQSFLKQTKQPYILYAVYQLLVDEYLQECKSLLDKIDKDHFLEWPSSMHFLVKDFPHGPGNHPLEEGHRHIANIIQMKINH